MMFGASGLKGEKVFDDYVARLSARPAAQRTAGG
jgi:glutathione S-transferase